MNKLLKSKKGGIPAINEIVMTVLNIVPKPILILTFVFLITIIAGFVMPVILNMFGYACVDHNGVLELYQVPSSNLVRKSFFDIQRGVEGILGIEEYQLPDDAFPDGNKTRLRIPSQCFIQSEANGTTITGYISSCTDCKTNANFFERWYRPKNSLVCLDDGYYISPGLLDSGVCSQCSPPDPYYYNHTNCVTEDECYFTITNTSLVGSITLDYIDDINYQKIIDLGAVERPQDITEFVNVQCTEKNKPSLYFFSIEVFNKTMWILLIAGYFLVIFAWAWYGQVFR